MWRGGVSLSQDVDDLHIDREWAVPGPFKDIIASGWHTANLIMRLYGGHYLSSVVSLVSLGIGELSWLRPVRPDDELTRGFGRPTLAFKT